MANTRETMGEQACLDALIADTLTYFEDDGVTKINNLNMHNALTSVVMNQCKSVDSYGFSDCANIETIDIQGTGAIASNAFSNDAKLKHLIMRGATVTKLFSDNTFSNTPIAFGEGGIYVDKDLLSTYKSNLYWNQYFIYPLEDYPRTVFGTIDDSWAEIITACSNGSYDQKYSVGDVKSMVIDGTTYYFQLVAKNADVLASDGTTTVPTTWLMFKKFYGTKHRMNETKTTEGGWASSEMRSWLSDTVFPLLPAEVQAAVKEVRKYSGTFENGVVVKDGSVTADKLWIPSNHELNMSTTYETQGATYSTDLYPNNSARRIKYEQSGSAFYWWLRSTVSGTSFSMVNSGGSANSNSASIAYGVVLGFCI